MTTRDTILNELIGLGSDLAAHTPEACYQVPQGYFEGLASEVIARIKALEAANASEELEVLSPLLTTIPKKTPYDVPAGYFDGLEEKMMQIIRDYKSSEEELEAISPLLSKISKKNPYAVPDGYFENLTVKKETAKVVSMGTTRKLFKYAAAAVFIGIVAISAVLVFGKKKGIDDPHAWVEKNVTKKISKEQLDEFVALTSGENHTAQNTAVANEVKELMKDVSEKEIQDFLEETGVAETDDSDIMLN